MDPVTTAVTEELIAKVINASFSAFEVKLSRDDVVNEVTAALRAGRITLQGVPEFIVSLRDTELAKFKT